jgi:hypothetical protein
MPPCTLRREDCLVGIHLAERLRLADNEQPAMANTPAEESPFWISSSSDTADTVLGSSEEEADSCSGSGDSGPPPRELSLFERVVTSHPPVLESLLSQIPTRSIFNLHQSSRYLRSFLEEYPLAWKALSFRLPQPTVFPGSPGIETPDSRERQSKQYALDALLISVVIPLATRLRSLDLCNTAVSGVALVSKVLQPRIETLEHLSVRGCKNVSIKYHIVPFLQLHSPHQHPWVEKLALKSLYTYRCRHHRRRPYLPSSLLRRDSDSEPTHELIEICHQLGIWTDTAWCPTPGARCFRRKDYHGNRAAPGTTEVWVPFDRLWRSGNRIGPTGEERKAQQSSQRVDGRLWEDNELGHDGEALGTEGGPFPGDGKYLPAHLRRSHTTFVDNIKCDQCGDAILERCETCSIKMHCMGCRKTLCGSCAFNRPIPRKRTKVRRFPNLLGNPGLVNSSLQFSHLAISAPSTPSTSQTRKSEGSRGRNRFWWAPGASRSPNIMSELPPGDDSDDFDDTTQHMSAHNQVPPPPSVPLKLDMHWCCLEPIFSGGGGVAFLGPGISGSGSDRIRAVPLPKQKQYEDPDFMHTLVNPDAISNLKNVKLYEEIMGENVDILPYLGQESLELQANTCPRSLCQECYRSFRWKVSCRGCKRPLCKEHDFRALKVRKCGFRDLSVERDYVKNPPPEPKARSKVFDNLRIPAFRKGLRPESGSGELDEEELPMLDQPSGEGTNTATDMARGLSTASSSAESSQFLLVPPLPATDRPSSINNFDMSGPSIPELPPRSVPSGPSSSRQRSVSLSGLEERAFATSSLQNPNDVETERKRQLLPCHESHPVQWEGCGSFFCQPIRPVGDSRVRCTSQMRECGECTVLVCEVHFTFIFPS